jgi:polyisoprenoid-binding protein YceI
MKKVFVIALLAIIAAPAVNAQKYFTRSGIVSFFSKTKMENIDAENNKVAAVLDASTGNMEFTVLIKSFMFEKALMQEHFNENYMESDTYPKATFKGKIDNLSSVKFGTNGTYNVKVTGDLLMHGVTKKITVDAGVVVKDGKVIATSKFAVNPKDYNIEIPSVVQENISEKIDVSVSLTLEELQK